MSLQRGAEAARHQRFLPAFELSADRIQADAGERCEEDKTAEHREHDPLAAAEPCKQANDADHQGDDKAVSEALLRRLQQVRDAQLYPAKGRPGGQFLAGRHERHFIAANLVLLGVRHPDVPEQAGFSRMRTATCWPVTENAMYSYFTLSRATNS